MKCAKKDTIEEMREELVNDGYEAEALTRFEVIDLWLEAAQEYHKNLRGVKFEQTKKS